MDVHQTAKKFCYNHLTCMEITEGANYIIIRVLNKDIVKVQLGLIGKLPHTKKASIRLLPWWKCLWSKSFVYVDETSLRMMGE